MVVGTSDALLAAAENLDAKLRALARKATIARRSSLGVIRSRAC
jgi:hypothetical protein